MVAHDGTILLVGGWDNEQKCLKLDHGTQKEHSTLNKARIAHSIVTTQEATFLFGSYFSNRKTYDYLPKDSTKWLMGKTEIPEGFSEGCAGQKIWLIGGVGTKKRILNFDVESHTISVECGTEQSHMCFHSKHQ